MLVAAMLIPMAMNAQTSGMQVTVAVNDSTMGTTNPAPGIHYFQVGDTCSVVALPNTGYRLSGWHIQMSAAGTPILDTTVNVAVPDVFNLIAIINGGSTFVVSPATVYNTVNVTANFEPGPYVPDSMLVNVAVNDTAMGTTIPAPGAHYFYEGDTCSVVAVANPGYVLSGWGIQMSVAGNIVLDTTIDLATPDVFDLIALMNGGNAWVVGPGDGNYTIGVTANFVDESLYIPDSMTVNVAVNDTAMGTTLPAPGIYRFGVGDTVSVVAVANSGYHLTGWHIQIALAGHEMDTTIDVAVPNVFEALAMIVYGGNVWEVDPLYVNATISVTANFIDAGQYIPDSMVVNVAVNNPAMGTTLPATGTHYFAEGDTCSVVAVANSGYHLTGWTVQISVGGTVAVDTTINIAIADVFDMVILIDSIRARGNMSALDLLHLLARPIGSWVVDPLYAQATFNLTANFAAGNPAGTHITYAVNNATRGTTTPAPGTYNINAGDAVTASATPNEGYELSAWIMEYTYTMWGFDWPVISDTIYANDPAFSNPVRFLGVMQQMLDTIPQIGMYVTAVFTPRQHTVTLNTVDATMGEVTPAGATTVNYGGYFTANAMPNAGYHFVNWVNDTGAVVSTENPYTFTVTEDVNLAAVFAVGGYYNVTVSYDSTMGSVEGVPSAAVFEGTQLTLTAVANEGYSFTGWSVVPGYDNILTDNPLTLTVTSDVTVTATFEQTEGIGDVEAGSFQVYSVDNIIIVKGVENMPVSVYDALGRSIVELRVQNSEFRIDVPTAGVYLVKVGAATKRVVVLR